MMIKGDNLTLTDMRGDFTVASSEATIQRVTGRNIEVLVVDDGDEARKTMLEQLPKGA